MQGWRIRLDKYRSTWSWFTTNPQGGGFGSNQVSSLAAVLARAAANIPAGEIYRLVVNGVDRGAKVRGMEHPSQDVSAEAEKENGMSGSREKAAEAPDA